MSAWNDTALLGPRGDRSRDGERSLTGAARGQRAAPALPLVARIRFQYPLGVALSLGLPLLVQQQALDATSASNVVATVVGVLAAVTLGYYALRRIAAYPTLWPAAASVASAFSLAFLVIVAWFFLLRIEYSRFQFVAGYGLSIAWFLGVSLVAQRVDRARFAVVALGEAASIREFKQADWTVLDLEGPPPGNVKGVVIDAKVEFDAAWQAKIAACALAGLPVYDFRAVREAMTGRHEVLSLADNVLASHDPNDSYLSVKRAIDFVTAAFALALIWPFLLLVGALVRLDSPGSALFRQTRVKRGGEPFTVYKFRTMTDGAADPNRREDAITRPGDARITRLGQFLRRTRIDELPQIYNVLRGDMSWIGPRAEALQLVEWYRQQLPMYAYRHIVPPGITGWAQVQQGHVTDPGDVLEKLHYDFYYIKHFSLWLDLLIVFRTLHVVWTGFGAR